MSDKQTSNDQKEYLRITNHNWAIFLISVLGLFLEMLLIRWIGTEVRIFAYLQNTILVTCFLGLGLGCFTSRNPILLRQSLIPLSFLLLAMAIPLSRKALGNISELLSTLEDSVIWHNVANTNPLTTLLSVALGLAITYFLLILIVDIFVPIGRMLGRLMDEQKNTILAYSINIAGSLIGTWLFVLLSFFSQPPFIWFVIFASLLFIFIIWIRHDLKLNLALLTAVLVLSWFVGVIPGSRKVVWSPYQKLVVSEPDFARGEKRGGYIISVNNTGFQNMIDLSPSHTLLDPERYPMGISQYDLPLLLHPNPKTYLIVGAGAGNDTAAGIRNGVKEITAVEIDPAIISIGRSYHPEKPYASSTVQIVNDDARSFFATVQKKFDVISFGYLDSHTTTAMTNAQLDHYVYTRESIRRAKSLLEGGGIMVLSFYAQKPYIADRMARVLREVFQEEPISFKVDPSPYYYGGVMFISGDLKSARNQIAQNPRLRAFIAALKKNVPLSFTYTTKVATDDWPYIYLNTPMIPVLYFLLAGLMVLILVRSCKRWQASGFITRWSLSYWHFFFLGAAFLLLEVQNISKASVVLGNTWQINAIIVSGVLAMALLANWIVWRFPKIEVKFVYAALIGVCLMLYFVDLAQFAFLPYISKALAVGCLTTLPIFFSGIIFIRSFAKVERKDDALGANLAGAIIGALLQSITFVIGIKALLLIVAGLYCLSFLFIPGQLVMKQTMLRPIKN